jgi:hypothetical protein
MGRFEPRDTHKGNAARAVFYVAAVYPEVLDADGAPFFETMRESLLAWNRLDPPDADERARSAWIARLQGTENPFVTDPGLADRAFGSPVAATPFSTTDPVMTAPPTASPTPIASSSGLWLSALHYDNAGDDTGEGVEIAGPPGARLDGWSLALYNGADGSVYRTVPLTGSLAGGRRWLPVDGLQNGAPDGVALVAPTGGVAEFWSYEGSLSASSGPAAGRRAQEMPVEEGGREPVGAALVRASAAAPWRVGAHPGGR